MIEKPPPTPLGDANTFAALLAAPLAPEAKPPSRHRDRSKASLAMAGLLDGESVVEAGRALLMPAGSAVPGVLPRVVCDYVVGGRRVQCWQIDQTYFKVTVDGKPYEKKILVGYVDAAQQLGLALLDALDHDGQIVAP